MCPPKKVVIYSVHVHAFKVTLGILGGGIFHALFIGSIIHPGTDHNIPTTLIIPISVCVTIRSYTMLQSFNENVILYQTKQFMFYNILTTS